jgi:vacuolar protein sorting-associated protein 72
MSEHRSSSPQKENSDSDSSNENEIQVESLVAGRQKRSTAGNRMNTLLAEEEEDDDLKLLFAEDGQEDIEFDEQDGEAMSDVDMDSSSDDEDQGPAAGGEDLDGEKELEKAAREERRKKRKAQEIFKRRPAPKPKSIAEHETGAISGSVGSQPRPKKKSERVSWLPTTEEGPVRASSRKQTVQNKQVVHERMRESEKRRRQQIKIMEAAAKRKEALKPKALTQEGRLAEAAKVEANNAKSLNRWEAAERKRVEEQRAKLAALKNRTLEGPVLTWWSGPSKWVDGKCTRTGKNVIEEVAAEISVRETKSQQVQASVPIAEGSISMDGSKAIEANADSNIQPPSIQAAILNDTMHAQNNHNEPSRTINSSYEDPLTAQQQSAGQQAHSLGTVNSSPMLAPTATPPKLPVTEILSRNLVMLDSNAIKLPELQDHVLVKSKKATTKHTSKSMEA